MWEGRPRATYLRWHIAVDPYSLVLSIFAWIHPKYPSLVANRAAYVKVLSLIIS